MGANAKQSGSSGTAAIYKGQYETKKRIYLGLTLLPPLEDPIDMDRCPAALRDVDATALGDCCCRKVQEVFNDDFIDGHSSEVIVATLCSRHLSDMVHGTRVACTIPLLGPETP